MVHRKVGSTQEQQQQQAKLMIGMSWQQAKQPGLLSNAPLMTPQDLSTTTIELHTTTM